MNQTLTLLKPDQALESSEAEASYGSLQTARGFLPLRRLEVEGHITGLLYRACISQTFVNTHEVPLEATYIFPLPARAGVTRFRMKVQDRIIEGLLKERGEAREIYDAAIRAGHRAAIAEEDRPEVFTMRAGNIAPGEAVAVELEMAGPLMFADGEATFRFPLVIAPRYMPGQALDGPGVGTGTATDTDAVPDASRISPPVLLPGQPNPVHLALGLEIDGAGLVFEEFSCSLHQVKLGQLGEGRVRLELDPGSERLDRDFIVRFKVAGEQIRSGLAVARDPDQEEGSFALTLVPPTLKECGMQPRDVVVLLDRSGSMQGWKMVAARRAAARLIDSLTPADRFGIILFDDRLEEPAPSAGQLVNATDRARFRAMEFLARVEARGGTAIAPALTRSLQYFGTEDRERIVVFVTDGQVGNEDQLLRQVDSQARGCRIFSIGIDRSVNASLLERLAQLGGGSFELVESEDRLDEVLRTVHRRIGVPLVRDLKLEHPHWDATPEHTDLFPGVPARVYGRLRGTLPEQVNVTGVMADGSTFRQTIQAAVTSDGAVRTLWARARVLDMEHRFACGNQDRGMVEKITQFSLQYGVLCRFTAFVAVDRQEVVNPGGQQHQVTQAVEPVSGWEMLKAKQSPPASRGMLLSMRAVPASLGGDDKADDLLCCEAAPNAFGGADPFAIVARGADPFGAPAADPFAAASPMCADPFGVAHDPFGAPAVDPFACAPPAPQARASYAAGPSPFSGLDQAGPPFAGQGGSLSGFGAPPPLSPPPPLMPRGLCGSPAGATPVANFQLPAAPGQAPANTPGPPAPVPSHPQPKQEAIDPSRLAEQLAKLEERLRQPPFDLDVVDAILGEILSALGQAGVPREMQEKGQALRVELKAGKSVSEAGLEWIQNVRAHLGLSAPPAPKGRQSWWKR